MPIYEYQCGACTAVTDIRHGFKETVSEPCAACGGTDLKRLFKPAGIVFKGSGFYVTDSRKAESGAKAPAAGAAQSDSAGPASKSADAAKSDSSAAPAKDSSAGAPKSSPPAGAAKTGTGDAAA